MIPNEIHITIAKALEENRELRELYETDQKVKELLDVSMALEGMPKNTSTHACRSCNYKRSCRYLCSTL